jgi:5-methyltetrahydrofolate--homocysteine methyltransferase
MTDAERKVWEMVRARKVEGHYFRRQVPIGAYIADFACIKSKLVVEIDGGQHFLPAEQKKDDVRTQRLEGIGFRVLRFTNKEALENIEGVYRRIKAALESSPPAAPT